MILEIIVAIAFPLALYLIGKLISPKKPNKHKREVFSGGMPYKNDAAYLDKKNIIYVSLVLTLESAILILMLSSGYNMLTAIYAIIVLLGVWIA